MNRPIAITDDIYWVGVNDRETKLFEGIWPLPEGVSYNAYIINDDKTALIDTVKNCYLTQLLQKIQNLLGDGRKLDYLIINHMEPDHSGAIEVIARVFPDIRIIGNQKTIEFLEGYYGITRNVSVVKDGDILDLGRHKLCFYLTPMVHWPETMMTYDTKDKLLFSGDAFGGFGALNGGLFDDEIDLNFYEDEILRYYANIVGKYSPMVQRAFTKLAGLEIKIIAATHGAVWRKNPKCIIDYYDRWSRYEARKGVMLAYASMYGNTKRMAEAVARGLVEGGIEEVRMHNVSESHVSFMIKDAWKFRGIILGSCTYDLKLFPLMKNLTDLLEHKLLKNRHLGIFGSYGWSGGALTALQEFAANVKWDLVKPQVEALRAPSAKVLEQCRELGKNMAAGLNA